jgi:UDP-N-acetylmuramate dehydrogenase
VALAPLEHVPLAPLTTMRVGGTARFFVEADDEATVGAAAEWARQRGVACQVLGGGSNLVIADEGVDGLVVRIALRGVTSRERDGMIEVTAAAGESWDELVRTSVERSWAGLECLSGIPGLVGATPIQNVGAYGQEVSDTIVAVRALERATGRIVTLSPDECGFAYRDSAFKSREPDRHVVLAVTYRLAPGAHPAIRYADIEAHLASRGLRSPSLADVRQSVLAIRRTKSMVLDDADPNRRSCGSFFLNPIIDPQIFARVETPDMPRWPQADGRTKLSAAWLIQHAGFAPGHRAGTVGLSTRHTLAIVCHGGATARDVVALARTLRTRVEDRFGVRLVPEPVFWGGLSLD